MFWVFSIIHFRKSNQILKDTMYNDDSLYLPIKNPNSLLKNGLRIRIPKLAKNWANPGFGLPTLLETLKHLT